MNYVDEMLYRANTQQVANFFMGSGEIVIDEKATYKERIDKADRSFIERINKCKLDEETKKSILEKYFVCASDFQIAFTEIGIKLGAKLLIDLLDPYGN